MRNESNKSAKKISNRSQMKNQEPVRTTYFAEYLIVIDRTVHFPADRAVRPPAERRKAITASSCRQHARPQDYQTENRDSSVSLHKTLGHHGICDFEEASDVCAGDVVARLAVLRGSGDAVLVDH